MNQIRECCSVTSRVVVITLFTFISLLGQTQANQTKPILPLESYPLYSPSTVFTLKGEEDLYTKFVRNRIKKRGEQFRNQLPTVVKFIAIGAGPFNAIYIANRHFSPTEALILEGSNYFGKFDELSDTFQLNSAEQLLSTGNLFAGSPTQLRHHNLDRDVFPDARALADTTIDAIDFSEVPVLFNEKVELIEFEPSPGSWPARYRVRTHSNLEFYTSEISVGIGLGTPLIAPPPSYSQSTSSSVSSNPVDLNDESVQISRAEQAKLSDLSSSTLPSLLHSDDFLTRTKNRRLAKIQPLKGYSGKSVAVLGGGHGAMTTLLALTGHLGNGIFTSENLPRELHWIGFKFVDGRSVYAPLKNHPLIRTYPNSRALGVRRASSSDPSCPHPSSPNNHIRVEIITPGHSKPNFIEVDQVITAYGYENQLESLFTPGGQYFSFQRITGFLPERSGLTDQEVQIGQQITRDGVPESIYLVGGCSLVTEPQIRSEEQGRRLGTIIEILGGRTAALARSHEKNPRIRISTQDHLEIPAAFDDLNPKQLTLTGRYHDQMEFRKALGRVLNQIEVDSPESMIYLIFSIKNKRIHVQSQLSSKTGLNPAPLMQLLQKERSYIQKMFSHKISKLSHEGSLQIQVPLSHGEPQLHFMQITSF